MLDDITMQGRRERATAPDTAPALSSVRVYTGGGQFTVVIVTFTAGVDYLTCYYTAVSALQLLIHHRHHPQCEYTLAPGSLKL
ncbi:hypothetical protein J6590_034906 [Homalodisca vitripennis]|nr:hypothetical protein J6590_034906 [Homalodisca vitripennis]